MMKILSKQEFEDNLKKFSSTENWYPTSSANITFTDGIKYLILGGNEAETVGVTCQWLLNTIVDSQMLKQVRDQEFQVWIVNIANNRAILSVEDGNENEILSTPLGDIQFPVDHVRLFYTNGVIMLPGEY